MGMGSEMGMYDMGSDIGMNMNHDMANWEFDMEMSMMPSFEEWKSQQAQQENKKKMMDHMKKMKQEKMMKQWMEANMDFDLESDCEHEEERKMVEMMKKMKKEKMMQKMMEKMMEEDCEDEVEIPVMEEDCDHEVEVESPETPEPTEDDCDHDEVEVEIAGTPVPPTPIESATTPVDSKQLVRRQDIYCSKYSP